MTDHKPRPLWPLIAALIVLPVLYLASFGPACWYTVGKACPVAPAIYAPLGWAILHAPEPVSEALAQYALIGMAEARLVYLPAIGDLVRIAKHPLEPDSVERLVE